MGIENVSEEILIKISKLKAKADSAAKIGNQHEAEAFASKVTQLLMEYNIEMSSVESLNNEKPKVTETQIKGKDLFLKNESNWLFQLYKVLVHSCFCRLIIIGGYKNTIAGIEIFGTGENLEMCQYLHSHLQSSIRNYAKQAWKDYEGFEKRNAFIRGFYRGAVEGISSRLANERMNQVKLSEDIRAIILKRNVEVNEYVEKKYPKLCTHRSSGRGLSGSGGYNRGYETGKSMNINKGIGGSNAAGQKLIG